MSKESNVKNYDVEEEYYVKKYNVPFFDTCYSLQMWFDEYVYIWFLKSTNKCYLYSKLKNQPVEEFLKDRVNIVSEGDALEVILNGNPCIVYVNEIFPEAYEVITGSGESVFIEKNNYVKIIKNEKIRTTLPAPTADQILKKFEEFLAEAPNKEVKKELVVNHEKQEILVFFDNIEKYRFTFEKDYFADGLAKALCQFKHYSDRNFYNRIEKIKI